MSRDKISFVPSPLLVSDELMDSICSGPPIIHMISCYSTLCLSTHFHWLILTLWFLLPTLLPRSSQRLRIADIGMSPHAFLFFSVDSVPFETFENVSVSPLQKATIHTRWGGINRGKVSIPSLSLHTETSCESVSLFYRSIHWFTSLSRLTSLLRTTLLNGLVLK